MTLHLSAKVQRQVTALLHTLLIPLDYDDVDKWRYDVSMNLSHLFEADRGYFALPIAETHYVYPEHISPSVLQTYPNYMERFNQQYDIWSRSVALGVHHRRALFGPWWDEIMRSSYMQEFIPAIRGYSSVCATVLIDPNARPQSSTTGQLSIHFDASKTPSDNEHNEALMRLLYPAFTAGLRTFTAMRQHRQDLGQAIDALGLPALLCDANGKVLHETPALRHLLDAEPNRAMVQAAINSLVQHFVGDTKNDLEATLDLTDFTVIRTNLNTYSLRAIPAPSVLDIQGGVLISIHTTHPITAVPSLLAHRFDLTPQQAKVALLLAQRKTNREIATTLHISPHTARHHTEEVLSKLGISSRRLVRSRLQE